MFKARLLVLILLLLLTTSCVSPAATPVPTSPAIPGTPSTPVPTAPPTTMPTPTPMPAPGLPDLVWNGKPTIEPLAPIVGDRLHIKQTWTNTGSSPITSAFEIGIQISKENASVFEQFIKVQQPVNSGEVRTLDIIPEYAISEPGDYKVVLTLDPKKLIVQSKENNHVVEGDLLQIPDLSKEPPFSKEPDTAAIAQATKDIEKYRKGDAVLTVVDGKGKALPGVKVEYYQTGHSFLFGIFDLSRDERVWSLALEAGINYATVVLDWQETEPQPGVYQLRQERTSNIQKYGLAGMAHALIFLSPGMSDRTPDYITKLSFSDYKNSIYPHITRIVNAYKQQIKVWNIFNEPMRANLLGLTEKQTIEIIGEGARAVRDSDQSVRILINNTDIGGENPEVFPYDFLQKVIQAGVDFDVIGLEFYYNACVADGLHPMARRTLSSMGQLIDQYSTLGKKVHITEISVPSEPIGEGYWGQPWSEELQAEYLKAAYTIFFSKLQVEAIGWWNVTDKPTGRSPFIYHGAILNEQNQPKKSYYALKSLIRNWTTTGAGATDDKGQVIFRGFGGTYEVTVTDNKTGLSKKQGITIEEQKQNLITIVLD